MKELGRARIFSSEEEPELLIEAQAPVEGGGGYRAIAFKASRIDCVFAIEAGISAILLDNGVTIPVALPFADLKQRVYRNDFSTGDSLDLSLVTGPAVGEAQKVTLAKKFNPVAEDAAKPEEKPIELVMLVHAQPNDREFHRVRFPETAIKYFEAHGQRQDKEIYIVFKDGCNVDGMSACFAAIPLTSFAWLLDKYKKDGAAVLDICEATRPKDVSALKM